MIDRRYVVVSPVRDEALYIQRTIDSMVAQTKRPELWIIVDDGSSDRTAAIVREAAALHSWIRLHQRADRGVRKVGGGVVEAFNDGLSLIDLGDFDFVCKLDGDLSFGKLLFERLIGCFDNDPMLGTASGKCSEWSGTRWVRSRTSDDFSHGACKFFRTQCFKDIGGFVPAVMWDGIDCHRCRMMGWKASSFHDPELHLNMLRPMGASHKNVFHGRLRWGFGQYFMGTHWLYATAIAAYRLFERPYVIGGCCILAGYVLAAIRRVERYEDEGFRRFLRRWQLKRLFSIGS